MSSQTVLPAKAMKPGAVIEFLSDQQTDKGPSSGTCVSNDGETIVLSHSDTEHDEFRAEELRVERVGTTHDGRDYWALV